MTQFAGSEYLCSGLTHGDQNNIPSQIVGKPILVSRSNTRLSFGISPSMAHLSYCIAPFVNSEVKQEEYLEWGEAIGKGIADFYGL